MSFPKSSFAALAFTLFANLVFAQAFPIATVAPMPPDLEESSGLIKGHQSGQWWSHNDSGGDPELICFDQSGNVLRTVALRGVGNVDWEEVTADDSGFVYVGDFGNNGNNRQDLVIYRIPHPDLVVGDSVTPEAIYFSYPDQTAFPPPATDLKFDMEAMVAFGDSLHLFSKNRTSPFDGYTRRYTLPKIAGTYTATLVDSFFTGGNSKTSYWVCAAALSPNKEHLVLVSYPRAWFFSCFEGSDFFGGAEKEFTYSLTQKEGAAWANDDTLFLTDELFNGLLGGNLYRSALGTFTAEPMAQLGNDTTFTGSLLTLSTPAMTGGTYIWNTGALGNSLGITQSGTYVVTVVAPNGCTDTDSVNVDFVAGNSPRQDLQLHAFYDSANAVLRVSFTLPQAAGLKMEIMDIQGKSSLAAQDGNRNKLWGEGAQQLDIPLELSAGLYWLRAESESGATVCGFRVW
jgi:hypothetical protein